MRKVFRFFVVLLPVFLTTFSVVSVCRGQVLINEILADPARDWDGDGEENFRNDEWVEIVNAGDSVVDLDGYLLADGEGEIVCRYGFSGLLDPGAVRVVYGSESRAWEESNGLPVYGLSLNNAGDRVSLYRVIGPDTVLVDSIDCDDKAAEDDRSLGRSEKDIGMWAVFDAYNPCADKCVPAGCGCIPTPGGTNGCITAEKSESWGMIKRIYDD